MPYPTDYVQPWICKNGRQVILRPVKPDDEFLGKDLFEGLPETALRYRFAHAIKEMTHDMLTRLCNIDYDREMAIVAEYNTPEEHRIVGIASLSIAPGSDSGEFASVVAQDFEGVGLGLKLCDVILGIAREKRLNSVYAIILKENTRALGLAKRLGCKYENFSSEEIKVVLDI
jgi:acetyltransferase